MDNKTLTSLYEHIKTVGKSYYDETYAKDEETQEKLRTTLDDQLGSLPLDDQAEIVSRLKKESQKGFKLDDATGYGIIRDIYSEHLLDDLMASAKLKLSNIQSGSFCPESINEKIKGQLSELEPDQFDAFSRAVERYQTPINLDKTSKEREDFAWREVNNLMQEVALDNAYPKYEL